MAIALRVGELAKAQGLTIKALAARAGVSYNTAHALYTGRATRIDLDTLDRMCAALGVRPGDLLSRHIVEEPVQPTSESAGSYGTAAPQAPGDRRAVPLR